RSAADRHTWQSGKYRNALRVHYRLRGSVDLTANEARSGTAFPHTSRSLDFIVENRVLASADGEPATGHLDSIDRVAPDRTVHLLRVQSKSFRTQEPH